MQSEVVARAGRILGVDVDSPLIRVAKRYFWTIPVVMCLSFFEGLLEGLGISLLIPILTLLSNPLASGTKAVLPFFNVLPETDAFTQLQLVAAIVVLAVILKAAFSATTNIFVAWIDGMASRDIRTELSRTLLSVGFPFFLTHEPSRLINIIGAESWRAQESIRAFFSLISAVGSVVVFGCLLYWINAKLFLAVAIAAAALRWAHWLAANRLALLSEHITDANQALAEAMVRVASDVTKTVRLFGQQKREQERFDLASEAVRKSTLSVETRAVAINACFDILQVVLFVVILVGAWWTRMEVPVLVTFLALLYRTQPHLRAVGTSWVTFGKTQGSMREVEWLLKEQTKSKPMTGWRQVSLLKQSITFDRVDFTYPTANRSDTAISAASFVIRAGCATAIIGRSGAGKSTLVNLLCRLIDPTSGSIFVDGIDLNEIDPTSWRSAVAVAGQDVELIDGTIADNIAYGMPGATPELIAASSRAADAAEFISKLPAGYETPVGYRGLALSGGQRQRIGIARALIRQPSLLILDEATNAVDSISESVIQTLIAKRLSSQTVIVISHNARTRALCQDAIVLEDGRGVAAGSITEVKEFILSS